MNTDTTYARLPLEAFDANLGDALAMLQATKDEQQDDPSTPTEIHHKSIEMIPNAFQVRGITIVASHVVELLALLRQGRTLDPITLWRCGGHALLVDGHHRVEAYRQYGLETSKPPLVPCQWFLGTAVEAMQAAAEANTKVKLPMTHEQRANLAWAMVRAGSDRFSKAMVAKVSGVSSGTVATMRKTLKDLGDEAEGVGSWMVALMTSKKLNPLTDDQHKERQALKIAKQVSGLKRVVGDRWYKEPDMVPEVLDQFLGSLSTEIAHQWVFGSDHIGLEVVEGWLVEMKELIRAREVAWEKEDF